MYIRSSPRGPNRDPNRTLSNELLLYLGLSLGLFLFYLLYNPSKYLNNSIGITFINTIKSYYFL